LLFAFRAFPWSGRQQEPPSGGRPVGKVRVQMDGAGSTHETCLAAMSTRTLGSAPGTRLPAGAMMIKRFAFARSVLSAICTTASRRPRHRTHGPRTSPTCRFLRKRPDQSPGMVQRTSICVVSSLTVPS
jgi:hypothetical protein